jgi:SlyX protein
MFGGGESGKKVVLIFSQRKPHMTTTDTRINDLEVRMAHQDQTIADLNDVITAQWKKLDALERQLKRMSEELETMDHGDVPANQKPPHY